MKSGKTLACTGFLLKTDMMPNRSSDTLFQLIKSLEKGEKRNFKLYAKRNSSSEDLKIIELFDVLDRMEEYDESNLLKRIRTVKK
jgi:hypothetical protein